MSQVHVKVTNHWHHTGPCFCLKRIFGVLKMCLMQRNSAMCFDTAYSFFYCNVYVCMCHTSQLYALGCEWVHSLPQWGALMCGDVVCACTLSETVFHLGENSLCGYVLRNNHTWHFPLLQPVETSRCFPFQLNPLRPSLLCCNHWPVLWQGLSECQNSLFSITIKPMQGRGVKRRK